MKFLLLILILSLISLVQANDCNCRLKTENRVVNGEFAVEHSIPWIVSLAYRDSGDHFCGGAIMNEKYILTASHCTDTKKAGQIAVRVGTHDIKENIPANQIYKVKKIYQQEFKETSQPGDIAILELEKNIEFVDGKIEKGCFNLNEKEYYEPLLAAGWGMTERSHIDPETKKWVLNGYADKLKQVFFKSNNVCSEFSICLNPVNKGDSVCHGDSGGPLHYTENGFTTVEGVASFVKNAVLEEGKEYHCTGDAVYSRLSYYADWISEIADFNFCGTGPKTEPKYKKKFLGLF